MIDLIDFSGRSEFLGTPNLIFLFRSRGNERNRKITLEKTAVANLARNVSSGTDDARVRVRGKVNWESYGLETFTRMNFCGAAVMG